MNKVLQKRKVSFYLLMGITGLLAVVIGFFTTYIQPYYKGSFSAPAVVHIHGAFAFAWVVLFLVQTILVKYRKFRLHQSLGYFSLVITVGILLTMLPTGLFQVRKDLSRGLGGTAYSSIFGVLTTAIMFAILVGAGLYFRKRPKLHKRLFLLATIILLWPAWFRFRHYFPSVPRPDIWFALVLADSLILFAWIADKITWGKIHPVLLYGGLLIIAEHCFEVLCFDSKVWRKISVALVDILS